MFQFFIFFALFIFSNQAGAKSHKKNHQKSTVYSMCSRQLSVERKDLVESDNTNQTIIVATETLSENKCKILGKAKAEQYAKAGWKCVGFKGEESFSCESERATTYAIYNGKKLDHLTFTNLQKHRSLVAYINPMNIELCHEDKAELKSAGVKDAVCHKR